MAYEEYDNFDNNNSDDGFDNLELSHQEYREIFDEIGLQPIWRHVADKEMDYADGNQLSGDLLKRITEIGMPPAIENLIKPSLLSVQGYEEANRTDWRVTPNDGQDAQDIADAISFKLNEAERHSKADRACSDAFETQIACGIGWVEVSRESDPFKYPYRCRKVHRNEIHWDMQSVEPDLSDARWLRRSRWLDARRVMIAFPKHKDLIKQAIRSGGNYWIDDAMQYEGGDSTGLENAWLEGRSHSRMERHWYNADLKEICLSEVWYRRWVQVVVLKLPNGRVVEFDENNLEHAVAVAIGSIKPIYATIAKVRRAYWLGPHRLFDGESPYKHSHFPYVPFWGFVEDSTSVPYGLVRGMKYAQDSLNSGLSKLRWGMSVVRVERTQGAVAMTDEQLRRQIARPDADIILDPLAMAQQGAKFEVKRDYQLTDQHYTLLRDNREAIERVSSVSSSFMGKRGTATSGRQEETQKEQSNQGLGRLMDNFAIARKQIGELLMSMIIEDIGDEESVITIEGNSVKPDRPVTLNKRVTDEETGFSYVTNDIQKTRLMVSLEEVPSTNSYREQQLNALSEAIKPLPAEYLAAAIPFLTQLMDVPFKRDLIEAFRQVGGTPSQEEIEAQIKQAVEDALMKSNAEIKSRELDIKERKVDSEVRGLDAKAVQIGVQAAFAAMQAGAQVAQMPMISPIADEIMKGAGYQVPNPMGDDPNFPVPDEVAARNIRSPYIEGEGAQVGSEQLPMMEPQDNTSPQFPPVPQEPSSGMNGIETAGVGDNI